MPRYLLAWLGLCAIAFANGSLRELTLSKWLSQLRAHQLSTVTLLIAFAIFIFYVIRRWPPSSAAEAGAIGVIWLVLTLAFEFLFGHYVSGESWSELLAAYDLARGNLWLIVPLWVAIAPYLFFRYTASPDG